MHFKGVFFVLYMNPVALREAKIVYTFGLSECNRFKRKTFVFSEYIRIILFAIFSYFLTVKSRHMHSDKKLSIQKKEKKKRFPMYLHVP